MIKTVFETEKRMMRDVYCETLIHLAGENKNIMALDADLAGSSGMGVFAKAFPDRWVNCGIAEQNMVGVAAGLSSMGRIPFAHSFGTFATRRVCDQIFMSAAYAKLNVKIAGSDPGVCAAYNGGTHMPFEDMATLRAIPEITLVEPTDTVMLADLLPKIAASYGVFYIRLLRKNAVGVYESGTTFEIGKGVTLRDGGDVTLFCSGILVAESLKAAAALADEGISARVVNLHTWKPLDTELVVRCASETGAAVTCENHNVVGGLGSAVAETLVKAHPIPVEMIGTQDIFGEVGPEDYLRERFGMTAGDIVRAAKKAISRK